MLLSSNQKLTFLALLILVVLCPTLFLAILKVSVYFIIPFVFAVFAGVGFNIHLMAESKWTIFRINRFGKPVSKLAKKWSAMLEWFNTDDEETK